MFERFRSPVSLLFNLYLWSVSLFTHFWLLVINTWPQLKKGKNEDGLGPFAADRTPIHVHKNQGLIIYRPAHVHMSLPGSMWPTINYLLKISFFLSNVSILQFLLHFNTINIQFTKNSKTLGSFWHYLVFITYMVPTCSYYD